MVSLGENANEVPPIDGLLPLRVPIIGGSTKGWMLPNARRGAEQVAVDADTSGNVSGDISGDVTTNRMSVLDFNDRFVPPPEKTLTKGGAPVVKRWRRMLSFDPARCPPHLAARGGCAKEVSLGRWLANQGAAWVRRARRCGACGTCSGPSWTSGTRGSFERRRRRQRRVRMRGWRRRMLLRRRRNINSF